MLDNIWNNVFKYIIFTAITITNKNNHAMNLTAITFNGMHEEKEIPVRSISAWVDRSNTHEIEPNAIKALLRDAEESKQMQIYVGCIVEEFNGKIDAFDGTPLFTNGQESVRELLLDGESIWKRF